MKILYHMPSLDSIYAYRTIYTGFKNAFIDLGHNFRVLTANDCPRDIFEEFRPDLFITSSFFWYRKFLNFQELKKFRSEGMFTMVKIDAWNSPLSKFRINEAPSLKHDISVRRLIDEDLLGDGYFHVIEQDDERMLGFNKDTGLNFHTIPLAADLVSLKFPVVGDRFKSDISYVGTNLADKRDIIENGLLPLGNRFDLRIYGQDWTVKDRVFGWVQRGGQLFNIPYLRSIQKPKLAIADEGEIYRNSLVSVNIHDSHQRKFGGDCNERAFKIPLCGGFQVSDQVQCLKKYFAPEKEIIIGENLSDWTEKINYFIKNPQDRLPIIEAGRNRVLNEHTYHHRVHQMLSIVESSKKTIVA